MMLCDAFVAKDTLGYNVRYILLISCLYLLTSVFIRTYFPNLLQVQV